MSKPIRNLGEAQGSIPRLRTGAGPEGHMTINPHHSGPGAKIKPPVESEPGHRVEAYCPPSEYERTEKVD